MTKVFDGPQAATRLRDLGLGSEALREVVLQGERARAEFTEHDPLTAGAWDAYRYRVRAFRDEYVVKAGWIIDREGGVEKTWSPDRKHVVITRAGDSGVGVPGACPQPKRKPGAEIRDIVEDGTLLFDANWMNVAPAESAEFATWMLLVHREGDLVRSELSSPTGFTVDDRVLGWHERILLPEIDLTSPPEGAAEPLSGIDVPVVRKR